MFFLLFNFRGKSWWGGGRDSRSGLRAVNLTDGTTVSVNSREECQELQGKIFKHLWPSAIRKKPAHQTCAHFYLYILLFMEAHLND